MNFTALRAVIRNIKSHVSCPNCDNSYSNDDISIVSSIGDRCVIVAQCDYCKTSILITASLTPSAQEGGTTNINTNVEQLDPEQIVTSDDVMNVHQFLKDFKGDFGDIMKK